MSAIKERLIADMKSAMKSGDKHQLGVVRLVLAAVKQREVDERIELSDEQIIAVLDKMVKQRRESIVQYEAGGRADLVEAEQGEIDVLHNYLPTPLADDEINSLIADAIAETGAAGIAGMSKVMAVLKPKLQGRADVGQVSARVKAALGV